MASTVAARADTHVNRRFHTITARRYYIRSARGPSVLSLIALGVVVAGAQFRSKAAAPAPIAVDAVGTCPDPRVVNAALFDVIARPGAPGAGGVLARVRDLGARFEVSAADQTGSFVDPARDCAERARVAAVFIALALSPPHFESPAPPSRPAPFSSAAPAPAAVVAVAPPPAPPPRWIAVTARARAEGAPAGGGPGAEVVWGGELRVAVGRAGWGLAAGAGALAPAVGTLSDVRVRQQRFPFNLALTARRALPARLRLTVDAGVAAVLFTLRAEGLAAPEATTRLDVGARLAVELRLPNITRRAAPVLGLHAEYFPRTYQLDVAPLGVIGSSSPLWVGGTAGVVFESP